MHAIKRCDIMSERRRIEEISLIEDNDFLDLVFKACMSMVPLEHQNGAYCEITCKWIWDNDSDISGSMAHVKTIELRENVHLMGTVIYVNKSHFRALFDSEYRERVPWFLLRVMQLIMHEIIHALECITDEKQADETANKWLNSYDWSFVEASRATHA